MATLLIALGLAAQGVAAQPLPWLVGDWHCHLLPTLATADRVFEEYWLPDERGGLVGVGRYSYRGTRSLEHMRIAPGQDGILIFHGSPDGATPVAFPLVRMTADEAVFENPAHDYPQRIAYRSEGAVLIATVSLLDGRRARSWRYTRQGDDQRGVCRPLAE